MSAGDVDIDPARRELLLKALIAGCFAIPALALAQEGSDAAARRRSIHLLRGGVSVNGNPASAESVISGGDLVETGDDGHVIFTVDKDAFILRRNSKVQLRPPPEDSAIVEGLRVFTGALLSVFGSRRHRLETPVATIGIRGTGVYVEIEPDRDYVCTCYGITELTAVDDPQSQVLVEAGHHDPRYVLKDGSSGSRIRTAPFKNHTDAELTLIESLVGRIPAFEGSYDDYSRPRRRSY